MRFFVILVFILVVSLVIFNYQGEITETSNLYELEHHTNYGSSSSESYGFFDFVWDAISLIFKGSILGILIWGVKLYFDNE